MRWQIETPRLWVPRNEFSKIPEFKDFGIESYWLNSSSHSSSPSIAHRFFGLPPQACGLWFEFGSKFGIECRCLSASMLFIEHSPRSGGIRSDLSPFLATDCPGGTLIFKLLLSGTPLSNQPIPFGVNVLNSSKHKRENLRFKTIVNPIANKAGVACWWEISM